MRTIPTKQLSVQDTRSILEPGKNGPRCCTENFVRIMFHDATYAGVRYNELADRAEVHSVKKGVVSITPWTDANEAWSRNYIEHEYGLYSREKHADAIRLLFKARTYNPIIDIVDNIVWDGKPRCEAFLSTWMKCEDSTYVREVSRLIFAGGIHRLYAPGTKFDEVPILIGTEQGEGKTSIVELLAMNKEWAGEIKYIEGNQAIEQLKGKWICEIGELLVLTKRRDQEAVKAYITRTVDSYRRPYDRNVSELPRRCILIGTSNDAAPLIDLTGNRRYYPVEVHSRGADIWSHEQEVRDYIEQCWAEARERYKAGTMPPFANHDYDELYREAQENAMQDDWRQGAILAYLDKKNPGELVCVREIAQRALSVNVDLPRDPNLAESKDIGRMLNKMKGWKRCRGTRKCGNFGMQRCWEKIEETTMTDADDDGLPFDD